MQKSDDEWKQSLTDEQYRVLRQKGTEAPFSGELLHITDDGMYCCAACKTPLFSSNDKYESDIMSLRGWPSFAEAVNNDAIVLQPDHSLGMERTEVVCATCGGHLGHIFDGDDSSPSGKHYCINSAALAFNPKDKADES